MGFFRDDETDVAEADDAEGGGGRVVGLEGEGMVGFEEEFGVPRAGGEDGLVHAAIDGDDVVEGHVADGFGGGAGAVAVENACTHMMSLVSPVTTSSGA